MTNNQHIVVSEQLKTFLNNVKYKKRFDNLDQTIRFFVQYYINDKKQKGEPKTNV